MEKMDRSRFVGTPGSFITDCFFFDELCKICGPENAHLWLTAQLNARSFCATATPGTPQTFSAPTSPPPKVGVMDRESHFVPNLQAFSEHSKSFNAGSRTVRDWGDSGCKADGSSNFRSRFHSFSHSRKTDNSRPNKSWKQWKSYADGHPKAPNPRAGVFPNHISQTLPEHQEQSESPSSDSSESCENLDRAADQSVCSTNDAVQGGSLEAFKSVPQVASAVRKATEPNNRTEQPVSSADIDASLLRRSVEGERSMSMRTLQALVLEQESAASTGGMRMGLLFTDAAHTVLERQ